MISEATIKEFQGVVREELGVLLNNKEAQKIVTDLVSYFDLLAKINHRKKESREG